MESKGSLMDLLGDIYVQKHADDNSESALDNIYAEIKNYMKAPGIAADKCPLEWWKANEHKFPHLGRHARCLLAIPATSVPSERVFSTAGNIICSQRACLSTDNANMLIFIKHNKNFYNKF